MIQVTRFNGTTLYVNADLIQTVEGTPDTVITLTNEAKIVVKEPPDVVVAAILDYQHKIRDPKFKPDLGD